MLALNLDCIFESSRAGIVKSMSQKFDDMAKHKNPRYLHKQQTSAHWRLKISIPDPLASHYATKPLQWSTRTAATATASKISNELLREIELQNAQISEGFYRVSTDSLDLCLRLGPSLMQYLDRAELLLDLPDT
jgi:hypothetical protein